MKFSIARLHKRDLFKLAAIIDQETAHNANLPWPFGHEAARTFIEDFNTWGIWIGSGNGVLVGAMEIRSDCETAYLIGKQFRNQGYATEALKKLKEMFADRQLWCYINPENKASLRVAQKANMRIVYYNNQ